MAKNITIKVPGKHPQTGEHTTFERGYRIALLGGWLTARYEIPENKPSRTACAQTDWWPSTAHCSCWTGSMASGY